MAEEKTSFHRKYILTLFLLLVSILPACANQDNGNAEKQERSQTGQSTAADLKEIPVSPEVFGGNISAQVQTGWTAPFQNSGNTDYQNQMKKINWPILRINLGGDLLGQLFSSPDATPDWTSLDYLIKNISSFHTGKIMVTLGRAPAWIDSGNSYHRELLAGMAGQVAKRFINAGVKVDYWEVINEPEALGKDHFDDNCLIFNEAAKKLKALDPSTKVGGPVLAWPHLDLIQKFITLSGPYMDFLSYHQYATGDMNLSTDEVMARAAKYKEIAASVRKTLDDAGYTNVPIAITEYNMNYEWVPTTDPRQATVTGAVFAALAMTNAIEGGVTIATIWESYGDGNFGAIGIDYKIRPQGWILSKLASIASGKAVLPGYSVSDKTAADTLPLKVLAVKHEGGGYSVIYVNYGSGEDYNVSVTAPSGTLGKGYSLYELSSQYPDGYMAESLQSPPPSVRVPANSVVILTAY